MFYSDGNFTVGFKIMSFRTIISALYVLKWAAPCGGLLSDPLKISQIFFYTITLVYLIGT